MKTIMIILALVFPNKVSVQQDKRSPEDIKVTVTVVEEEIEIQYIQPTK